MIDFSFRSRCLPRKKYSAKGQLGGQQIEISVDHPLAKLMIEDQKNEAVIRFFTKHQQESIDTHTLAVISCEYSVDVATIFFITQQYNDSKNKIAQDLYFEYSKIIVTEQIKALMDFHLVFIPGLGYKEDKTTGADFERQRKLLSNLGISSELIETEEWGLCDANASLIAKALKMINASHEKVLLVSASKGGLETAIALGKLLDRQDLTSIKAWVSVGGILRGSPIADTYSNGLRKWFARFLLWRKGQGIGIVNDLSYNKRSATFSELRFPEGLKVFHYVGIPWATEIDKKIKSRYCRMRHLGPNDGLTPIADELTNHGIVITEPGLDHYYKHDNIDRKTLALAMVAVQLR